MSEYEVFRCDHCNGPKIKEGKKRLKPIYKRIKEEKLYDLVKSHILAIKKDPDITNKIFAEKIAEHFQVKTHRIIKIFMKLNQEGIISQAYNNPPHDCRRATTMMDWGMDNSWMATRYYII